MCCFTNQQAILVYQQSYKLLKGIHPLIHFIVSSCLNLNVRVLTNIISEKCAGCKTNFFFFFFCYSFCLLCSMESMCCHILWSDYRWGFGLDIGFIDHLYTRVGTANNYSTITNLHNSQITTAPTKSFPACCVFISHSLLTVPMSGDSSASHAQVLSKWQLPFNCLFFSQTPIQN
jgi:hypothetical protein